MRIWLTGNCKNHGGKMSLLSSWVKIFFYNRLKLIIFLIIQPYVDNLFPRNILFKSSCQKTGLKLIEKSQPLAEDEGGEEVHIASYGFGGDVFDMLTK